MDIACLPEDVREGITTHQELDPANMLSPALYGFGCLFIFSSLY